MSRSLQSQNIYLHKYLLFAAYNNCKLRYKNCIMLRQVRIPYIDTMLMYNALEWFFEGNTYCHILLVDFYTV